MNVWVDLTNSPHVLVLRPVIERLRSDGHDVRVTARDFAQTLGLCERFGIEHEAIGRHRGSGLGAKAIGLADRSLALRRWARGRHFDLAIGHGSNDITVAAKLLRIPSSTMFDYEWATVQHNVNCRLARAVVVPDAIPPERLYRYGAKGKLHRFPGLKEEYYLADFEPDPTVLTSLGLDPSEPITIVRTPPAVSLYHRFENDLFAQVLNRLRGGQTVVLPRTDEQRSELVSSGGFIVPESAIDAQSLIAYADLVVSAGGTMNREAVALGTPVVTIFEGRLGAVDERLIGEGRLRRLERAEDVVVEKLAGFWGRRGPGAAGSGRDRRDAAEQGAADLADPGERPRPEAIRARGAHHPNPTITPGPLPTASAAAPPSRPSRHSARPPAASARQLGPVLKQSHRRGPAPARRSGTRCRRRGPWSRTAPRPSGAAGTGSRGRRS